MTGGRFGLRKKENHLIEKISRKEKTGTGNHRGTKKIGEPIIERRMPANHASQTELQQLAGKETLTKQDVHALLRLGTNGAAEKVSSMLIAALLDSNTKQEMYSGMLAALEKLNDPGVKTNPLPGLIMNEKAPNQVRLLALRDFEKLASDEYLSSEIIRELGRIVALYRNRPENSFERSLSEMVTAKLYKLRKNPKFYTTVDDVLDSLNLFRPVYEQRASRNTDWRKQNRAGA